MASRVARVAAQDAVARPRRQNCPRCRRALTVCACRSVERALGGRGKVRNKTHVLVLQDRAEFKRALGSAVVCELALERCEIKVLFEDLRERGSAVKKPFADGEEKSWGVLWPCDEATDLSDLGAESGRLRNLIVLDSTWHRAKAMYYRIPWLSELAKYSILPRKKSNYRIRKQPNEHCLSTAECVSEALIALEGEESGAERVSLAFDAMIDDQLDAELRAFESGPRVKGRPSAVLARERDVRSPSS